MVAELGDDVDWVVWEDVDLVVVLGGVVVVNGAGLVVIGAFPPPPFAGLVVIGALATLNGFLTPE